MKKEKPMNERINDLLNNNKDLQRKEEDFLLKIDLTQEEFRKISEVFITLANKHANLPKISFLDITDEILKLEIPLRIKIYFSLKLYKIIETESMSILIKEMFEHK